MKLFYSELAVNPALYSFGYSVYGVLEASDRLDELYERGFVPFVGAKRQEKAMLYLVRGSRVVLRSYEEGHYQRHAKRKRAETGALTVTVYPKETFPNTDGLSAFFLEYFRFRFGKESMSKERFNAILASPFVTHVSEYKINDETAGYMLEVHGETFVHVWYQAYAKAHEGKFLGLSMFIDLIERAKAAGKQHMYFGITVGSWMTYKTKLGPLEYFDGARWVGDKGNKRLKRLLKGDTLRTLALTDSWRDAREPFYKGPYGYEETRYELRLIEHLFAAAPRISVLVLLLLFCGLLFGALFFYVS